MNIKYTTIENCSIYEIFHNMGKYNIHNDHTLELQEWGFDWDDDHFTFDILHPNKSNLAGFTHPSVGFRYGTGI